MKCHYTYVDGEKILIPYCYAVIYSDDIRDCTCKPETFHAFETVRYNTTLDKLQKEIAELNETISHLMKEIDKLKNQSHDQSTKR
jgi:hypothetical protein